ncbi:MAG: PCRF domain-containing protein [Candidatus Shikimatogenerans bostrichidophilus]|nr:MAG: PCRF domain-containing protein [Candidatus Shikimatogenerans bostrichidophilus]
MRNLNIKIKKIKKKYKYIYDLINGKILYLKKKYNKNIFKIISKIFKLYNIYKDDNSILIELKKLKNNTNNKDFYKEIKSDICKIKEKKINIIFEINKLLKKYKNIKKIKNYNKNEAIIELRIGTGGDEACLFLEDIFRMYIMYFKRNKIKFNILNTNKSKIGYREVIIHVKNNNIYNILKYESGVHRVQRIPKTETQGRLHTSAITVVVLPKFDDNNLKINSNDIKRFTFRSSGAGGQHVNKTESAIRLIHIPTNIIVECQEERSQHQNYEKALTILRSKIYDYNRINNKKKIENKRKILISTGDRSKKIRTYNYPQNRITDHRIKLSLYNLENIMNGHLELLLEKLEKK